MRRDAPRTGNPLSQALTWLEPKDGLAIDAETWRVAHSYHVDAGRNHNVAAHGAGVLAGLSVLPVGGMELGVMAGVGIDPLGRFVVVPSRLRLKVDSSISATGMAYVVAYLAPLHPSDDGRALEETTVQVVSELPAEPHLELARIVLSANASISYPEDPVNPRAGEIDARYRAIAGGHARGEVTVAEVELQDAGDAHAGVASLVARAINLDGAYRARYLGKVQPGDGLPDSTLLYVSGNREFSVSSGVTNWLKAFLDGGGTLVGDGCHATPADPFGGAFDKLSREVSRQMRRVAAGERLLVAHHLFGAPPPGLAKADSGLVLAGGGVIYMASDFGCILSGDGDPAPARSSIRACEEFATNLAATAHERAGVTAFLE